MTSRRAGSRTGTDDFLPPLFPAAAVCVRSKNQSYRRAAPFLCLTTFHLDRHTFQKSCRSHPWHVRLMGFARHRIRNISRL
jgi:hypothetical protein